MERAGVIVADNDVMIRGVLRSMLAGVGQDVFLAATGEEAVALALVVQAKLVLLDLAMPKLNGFQACERLRALRGCASTPIVILTTHHGEGARQAAARVGATLFLVKPFQPAALLQSLSPFLDIDVSTQEKMALAARRAREIATPRPKRDRDWPWA